MSYLPVKNEPNEAKKTLFIAQSIQNEFDELSLNVADMKPYNDLDEEKIIVKWESPLMIRKHGSPRLLICQLDVKPRIIGYAIDYKKLE